MKKTIIVIGGLTMLLFACQNNNNQSSTQGANETPPVLSEGKALFVNNCAVCHDLKQDKTGPKLEGVLARWKNDTTKVKAFIKNSSAVIASGDEYATKLYHQWASTTMTQFPSLTDDELNKIIDYINKGDN